MSAQSTTHGPDANPTKSERPTRDGTTREGAHDDDSSETVNSHRWEQEYVGAEADQVGQNAGARYLEAVDPERVSAPDGGIDFDELRAGWLEWCRREVTR